MNSSNTSLCLVVDGHSLAYRSFFGFPPTLTYNEKPINAVFGFLSLLYSAVQSIRPEYLVVAFDRREKTFRSDIFPEYKAHRDPPPQIFIDQFPILKESLKELGVPMLELAGYEADDIMGTIAKYCDELGQKCRLLTSDRDTYQLVSETTHVLINKKGVSDLLEITPAYLMERFGIEPHQFIDLKALQGDVSDNIPGVKGVGEKTGLKLIKEYTSLEGVYDQIDTVKSASVQSKLVQDKQSAFMSYDLARICCETPIELDMDQFQFAINWDASAKVFDRLGFKSLINRYQKTKPDSETTDQRPDGTYRLISSIQELEAIVPDLKAGFAIDLETTSLSIPEAQIVGVALSFREKEGVYLPCNETVQSQTSQTPLFPEPIVFKRHDLLERLAPILQDERIAKYTHNGKYERSVLKNYGIDLRGITFDTLLAGFLLYPMQKVGLKEMVSYHFQTEMTSFKDLVQSDIFEELDRQVAANYAGADADYTRRLTQYFTEKLTEKPRLKQLLEELELPIQSVLSDMESCGVRVDIDFLAQLQVNFQVKLDALKADIFERVGQSFNLNSTQQLGAILYDKLGLTVHKRTKTLRSTDSSVLEKLTAEHPVAQQLLIYRGLEKLQSTYVKSLPHLVSPQSKRIHTSFNQTGTMTGRFSSSAPNLQNIPIRTEDGLLIRKAFIPNDDQSVLFSADYSQIELRLMAHLSEDANMIQAFQNDADIHQSTAARVFNVDYDAVTKDQRYRAKAVNFGILYGSSAHGLSQQLSISRQEAKAIIDQYFDTFPNIKAFMAHTIEIATSAGGVETLMGRFRPIIELQAAQYSKRSMGERMAVNTRVQGSAADIMKVAMIRIHKRLVDFPRSYLLIQVHDELVLNIHRDEYDAVSQLVVYEMEHAMELTVPLKVDIQSGGNWKSVSI